MENIENQLPVYGKKSLSSKVAGWWRSLTFMTKVVAVLAVTAVTLAGLATRSFQAAQIALIEQGYPVSAPLPPVTAPQPTAVPPLVTCQDGVKSLNLTYTCGATGFLSLAFTCNNGTSGYQGDRGLCYSAEEAMNYAYLKCKCSTTSTPTPTPIPTRTPTPTPSTSVCASEHGSCISTTNNCLTYNDTCAKADFCATPYKACGSPVPSSSVKPSDSPVPSGCYYKRVTCIKEPCAPVLICPFPTSTATPQPTVTPGPTSTPTPTLIQQVTGTFSTYRCRISNLRTMSWSQTKSKCR